MSNILPASKSWLDCEYHRGRLYFFLLYDTIEEFNVDSKAEYTT